MSNPETASVIALIIDNGELRFHPDPINHQDPNLQSWLDNTHPADLMAGVWEVCVPVHVAAWTEEDGPTLVPRYPR